MRSKAKRRGMHAGQGVSYLPGLATGQAFSTLRVGEGNLATLISLRCRSAVETSACDGATASRPFGGPMKRLASLVVVSSLALGMMIGSSRVALATPFSDVPANHWAYQYVQSLAADGIIDGYPDGKFKGDRPLTRYEMAVVVARAIAKIQENQTPGVSKQDLDKLQKLIDALKDELDALGVRVTNLEDSLDALNKRTAFAQSLSLHGNINTNYSQRDRTQVPLTVVNGTNASVTTYYGTAVAANKTAAIDPFVQAYLTSDDSNSPFTQAGPGINLRYDDKFSLAYQITDNLAVSFPVHLLNYEYGGAFLQQGSLDVEAGGDV